MCEMKRGTTSGRISQLLAAAASLQFSVHERESTGRRSVCVCVGCRIQMLKIYCIDVGISFSLFPTIAQNKKTHERRQERKQGTR